MRTHAELIHEGALVVNGARVPILSGEIQFFRMPPQTWDTALAGLKAAGLPMVSTYLSWRRFSLGPDQYDLDGRTDPRLDVRRFLDLCVKHDLWVTMKPGPWICAEEANGGYPDWLVEREDLCVLDAAGKPVQGYNPPFRSPIPSYLHPAYLDAVRAWFRQVDDVIEPYTWPRGPIILMQLDNEPSMTFHDRLLESDYNPVNVGEDGLYGRWLMEKYRTIADLNQAHGSSWRSFSAVQPPRSINPGRLPSLAPWADWAEFKERLMARHVEQLGRFHRENGLTGVLFTINYNEHPHVGVPNNWHALEQASGMGGFDFYPRMPLSPSGLADVALFMAYSRVCNAIPWSPEIMSGTWSFPGQEHASGELARADYEFLYLSALAFGLKGMNFYMFADRDNWIDSPLDAAGCPAPNLEAVRKVARLISEEPDFELLERRQDVAVLYYRPYAREAFIADASAGPLEVDGVRLGSSYACFKSLFTELHRQNMDPAVVDPWVRSDDLGKHRLIFVPGGRPMDQATLSQLDDFAAAGGKVVWIGQDGQPDREELARALRGNDISPAVPAGAQGILTVLHRSSRVEWLFVINTSETGGQVVVDLRDSSVKRLTALPAGEPSIMAGGPRVLLSCDPRSVQVWRLDRENGRLQLTRR